MLSRDNELKLHDIINDETPNTYMCVCVCLCMYIFCDIDIHFYARYRHCCGGNEGILPFTYWFKDKNQEQQYREQRDEQYSWYVVASNVVYMMMFCIQIIYLPRWVYA